MKLTKVERLLLANQFLILESLYPDEAKYYAERRKCVEDGYELFYKPMVFENIPDDIFSDEECREVLDILTMYRLMTFAYQSMDDKGEISEDDVNFPGFDGNNEKQIGFAEFLVNTQGKFKELNIKCLNSHTKMLSTYRKMLCAWHQSADENQLSGGDLKRILDARYISA